MVTRRLAAAILTGALALTATVATPSSAFAATHGKRTSTSAKAKTAKGKTAKVKASKPVKFTASGTVGAVDATAATLTVTHTHGTKVVRNKTITVSVSSAAKVVVNDVPATLADVQPAMHVTVLGTQTSAGFVASKVLAGTDDD
jgi:hypothetical protein